MAESSSLWWQALKKGGDFIYNIGEVIVGEQLKAQAEHRLKPVLKLLESPEARRAPAVVKGAWRGV